MTYRNPCQKKEKKTKTGNLKETRENAREETFLKIANIFQKRKYCIYKTKKDI